MALVRQWKLDETSGTTAADSSGNGDSGTYVSSPSLNQTGPGGSWTAAVAFTIGTGQYVSSLDGSSSIWSGSVASITGRFQCDDPSRTAAEQIIGEWGIASTGPCVYLYGDTLYAGFAVSGTFHYVSTSLSDTNWHSFVAVFNGTAMTLFLDGSSAATGTAGASFATASSTGAIAAGATTRTHLGANFGTGALPFGGKICDIRCYDDAKDASFASTYHAEQSAAVLTLDASPATITATPQSAGLTISRTLTASPASITVTPQSAGLTTAHTLTASPASITVTGQSSTLTIIAAGPEDLTASPAAIVVTPQVATLSIGRIIAAAAASVTLTPQSATLTIADTPDVVYVGKRIASVPGSKRIASVPGSKSFRSIPRGVVGRWY